MAPVISELICFKASASSPGNPLDVIHLLLNRSGKRCGFLAAGFFFLRAEIGGEPKRHVGQQDLCQPACHGRPFALGTE